MWENPVFGFSLQAYWAKCSCHRNHGYWGVQKNHVQGDTCVQAWQGGKGATGWHFGSRSGHDGHQVRRRLGESYENVLNRVCSSSKEHVPVLLFFSPDLKSQTKQTKLFRSDRENGSSVISVFTWKGISNLSRSASLMSFLTLFVWTDLL